MTVLPFSSGNPMTPPALPGGGDKTMLPSPVLAGREHDEPSYFVVPPTSGAWASFPSPSCGGTGRGVSVPRSAFLRPGPLSARGDPLCGTGGGRCFAIPAVCHRCHYKPMPWKKSMEKGRILLVYRPILCLALTIIRQSRSPRSIPSTSISAVATLEAKGMLF